VKARVFISLKEGILDPQGVTVLKALNSLGYSQFDNARVGKVIDLELKDVSRNEAEKLVDDACRRLLANSVIENYSFEVKD
jgi:phosphoribosylformylglycinamidine synthase